MATAEITEATLPGAEPLAHEGDDDRRPAVDVVVPVYNEQVDLGPGIRRLHAYLTGRFPSPGGSPSPTTPARTRRRWSPRPSPPNCPASASSGWRRRAV